MKPSRLASIVFSIVFVAIAACGDHVVVPSEKSGKCVAGLLTKCGDSCVDTSTDIANCGGCNQACGGAKICAAGKCTDACPPGSTRCGDKCVNVDLDRTNCGMCGKACAVNEVCGKGKCVASCEAVGYLGCSGSMGMLDAGGAVDCVNAKSDPNNCGACGRKCQMAEVCSNGVCCAAGQTACNGACVDTLSDTNNCGQCGTVCGMAKPNCAFGVCSKCKPSILVLSDGQTGPNTDMKNAFKADGFAATVIDNGATTYAGMPAATDFGVVMIARGSSINGTDMPTSGQQAIVTAQGQGVGLLFDAFVSLEHQGGRLQTIKPLSLMTFVGGYNGGQGTVIATVTTPWFAGIPTSFGVSTFYWNIQSGPMNGGTTFANFNANGPLYVGAVSRGAPNGRIVHYGYAFNYSGAAGIWANNPTMTQWTTNGARWAANCSN